MRLILSGLFGLLVLLLPAAPVSADPLTTLTLTGRFDGPNVAACSGTATCQASNTITINPPHLGPTSMEATIDASAGFDFNSAGYGLDGRPIPAGSSVLTGSLNTTQTASFGLYSQQQNPDVNISAVFYIPAESSGYQIHAFFYEGGDANSIPADSLTITAGAVFYQLASTRCTGGLSGYSCVGTPSADFTLLHDPGTFGTIEFYANSSAWYTGTDSANFQVVLTPLAPAAAIPEPGTLWLLAFPLAAWALANRRCFVRPHLASGARA